MSLDIDFKGKRVLVTAGTKGLGKAVVGLLKQLGATVFTTARHEPDVDIADTFVAADLTTVAGCAAVASAVQEQMGGVDVIIHVAGGSTSPGGGFAALGEEEWQQLAQCGRHAGRDTRAFLAPALRQGINPVSHMGPPRFGGAPQGAGADAFVLGFVGGLKPRAGSILARLIQFGARRTSRGPTQMQEP